ncbi:MAG: adenylyltransferase/cytidyltransferase family protein [bacterium]
MPNIEEFDPNVFDLHRALAVAAGIRDTDGTIGFTNGFFDLCHIGHVRFLRECRRRLHRKGVLIVAVNTDRCCELLKKHKPYVHEEWRREIVGSIMGVGFAFLWDETSVAECLEWLRPEIWFKGGDYTVKTLDQREVKVAEDHKTNIIILPEFEKMSTSKLAEDIRNTGSSINPMR